MMRIPEKMRIQKRICPAEAKTGWEKRETEYTPVMHGRIVSTLPEDNEGSPNDPDGEKPFTSSGQVPHDTRSAAGHPPARQIPERVPASEVPYANIPALPCRWSADQLCYQLVPTEPAPSSATRTRMNTSRSGDRPIPHSS